MGYGDDDDAANDAAVYVGGQRFTLDNINSISNNATRSETRIQLMKQSGGRMKSIQNELPMYVHKVGNEGGAESN